MKDTASAPGSSLHGEGVRLRPWHLNVPIGPGLSTRDFLEEEAARTPGSFYDPTGGFNWLLGRVYPNGLGGRSVLDCACNNGAYLFLAKEMGAGECVGFDVREHWIEQARFLLRNRSRPSDGIRFEVCDLYDLPALGLERFDIVLFRGILYHLPDPIQGLRLAADLTGELMIVSTAIRSDLPDGALVVGEESRTRPLSGVHGLQWYPTGPGVVAEMLEWAGMDAIRYGPWFRAEGATPGLDNAGIYAAHDDSVFDAFDGFRPDGRRGRMFEVMKTRTAPHTTVLFACGGDRVLLDWFDGNDERRVVPFPAGRAGEQDDMVEALETERRAGARYILFSSSTFAWLEQRPALVHRLQSRFQEIVREDACMLFDLWGK